MIIKVRNRILLCLTMLSITILVASAFFTGIKIYHGINDFPASFSVKISNFFFLTPTVYSTISSVFIMLIYVITSLFYISVQFEKTQSSEIIYFSLFLFSILFEFVRIFVPCLNLYDSYSKITSVISRLVLFSHVLSPLSLLYISIQNLPEHRQNVERNLTILLIISALIAVTVPLESEKMTVTCRLKFGFEKQFLIFWGLFTLITFISILQNNFSENSKSKMPLGFLLLAVGYKILCTTPVLISILAGTVLLITGTVIFLKELHKKYLWD